MPLVTVTRVTNATAVAFLPGALFASEPLGRAVALLIDQERRARREGTLRSVGEPDDLVVRCRNGAPGAFQELFHQHRASVAQLVHRMTGGSSELEDLVQEVFVQVHKSLGRFRNESRLSTWIYRIAVNVVLMHRRAARSRPLSVAPPQEATLIDEAGPPDEQLARRRRVEALYRVLDRVSEKKRAVYILHELEGLSPSEIGSIVGAPVLTVRTRLFYARREVVELLQSEPALAGLFDGMPASDPPPAVQPHKEPA
jgi:RNA polymerase sigma factor (sigma-70 family)